MPLVTPNTTLQDIKIVYLEDDLTMFERVRDIFQGFGFQVFRLPRALESLAAAEALWPDLILIEFRRVEHEYYQLLFQIDSLEPFKQIPKISIGQQGQIYDLLWTPKSPYWDSDAYPFKTHEFIERVVYWLEKAKGVRG